MRVVLSDEAKADLEDIGDYIAKRSPLRALSFIMELETKARELGEMPLAFPLVPRYDHHDIRRQLPDFLSCRARPRRYRAYSAWRSAWRP